jgi:uncharacterized protein (DUF697 family)
MTPHAIVLAFASLSAGVGAGLAPLPGADTAVLMSLQTAMIRALADRYNVAMGEVSAAELLLTLGASMAGRYAAKALLARIPGYGSAINAATAAAVTTAVGQAAIAWFDERDARANTAGAR